MPIACLFEWSRISEMQQLAVLAKLERSGNANSVNAVYDGGSFAVVGVWESAEALDLFVSSCFSQFLAQIGLPQPVIKTWSLSGEASGDQKAAARGMISWLFMNRLGENRN